VTNNYLASMYFKQRAKAKMRSFGMFKARFEPGAELTVCIGDNAVKSETLPEDAMIE